VRQQTSFSKRLTLKKNFRLYAILDRELSGNRDIIKITRQIIRGRPDVIQLRAKKSSTKEIIKMGKVIRKLTKKANVTFIINDRVDVVKACSADGVHLGGDDLPVKVARSILGEDKIIGVSAHNISQVIKAEKEGADYISIGPIFPTEIKPHLPVVGVEFIKKIKKIIKIPFVTIGGINQANIKRVLRAGAERVAVCRAIICASDSYLATKALRQILSSYEKL
jgi:thiamine-phosphate pyrophosphorylase